MAQSVPTTMVPNYG